VNDDQLAVHSRQARRDGLGAAGTARHGHRLAADVARIAGRHRHDDGADGPRLRERGQRPFEERSPPERYEGLRAAGPQPFAGAGGRDDR
jgi:hypothetical protein